MADGDFELARKGKRRFLIVRYVVPAPTRNDRR